MMRNFLSRQFETRLPAMARGFTQHSLETGGIIISPAGLPPEKAFRQLMNYMDIPKNDYGIEKTTPTDWDTKDVVELHNQKLLIIKNFYAIIKDRSKSARLIELILRKQHEGFSPVIQSDIDLHHWIYHRLHAEDMPEKEFYRWESLIINLPTFMLPVFDTSDNQQLKQSKASWQLPANSFRRTWEHCSEDEKIVLLGLRYEGVVNPRNKYTLSALYRRRVIEFRNGHFEFGDVNWHSFVGRQMHRAQFHTLVNNYKNSVWRAFRAPMLLSLLVLVLFIAYVAQDEMKLLFSLLGTVGAGAGVLSALSNRVKDLRGAASD